MYPQLVKLIGKRFLFRGKVWQQKDRLSGGLLHELSWRARKAVGEGGFSRKSWELS